MIILDTNVVSELMRSRPDDSVVRWVADRRDALITTITVSELHYGVRCLPHGRRREWLLERVTRIVNAQRGRLLGFDERAAHLYAEMRADRRIAGRPLGVEDGMIAGIAAAGGFPIATRNTRDFEGLGIDLVDPWASSAG